MTYDMMKKNEIYSFQRGIHDMCLVNFNFHDHPKYKLIVVANRDEQYARPTASANFWEDAPTILAGRDLQQMGTWFGVTTAGRFAALTNYRDPSLPETGHFSRGNIVRQFLSTDLEPIAFMRELADKKELYAGFNVIVGDSDRLYHYNNVLDEMNEISPGTHSLSNHTIDTPWPKVVKGTTKLADYARTNSANIQLNPLFDIVSDQTIAKDEELPHTGVGLEMERLLSPLFIKMPHYGTRSSTVLLIDKENHVTFVERVFLEGEFHKENQFTFKIDNIE